jgi:hypothetical protein
MELGFLFDLFEADPELADFMPQALGLVADAADVLEAAFLLLGDFDFCRHEFFGLFFRWRLLFFFFQSDNCIDMIDGIVRRR